MPATKEIATTTVDWSRRRHVVIGGYLSVLGVYVLSAGLPVDRIGMTAWIVVGLATLSVGRGWRGFGRVLLDWLPFQGILLAYDFSRGFAGQFDNGGLVPPDGARNIIGAPLHTKFPIDVDRPCSVACCRPNGCRSICTMPGNPVGTRSCSASATPATSSSRRWLPSRCGSGGAIVSGLGSTACSD